MERFGHIDVVRDYLTELGLDSLIDNKYILKVTVDGEYKGSITAYGDCNYSSVVEEIKRLGWVDPYRNVSRILIDDPNNSFPTPDGRGILGGTSWRYSEAHLGPFFYGRAFVCEVITRVVCAIYVSTKDARDIDPMIELYGCPNAMLHDADGLRRRRTVSLNKYE